jgi:hypothetical protein
MIIYFCTPDVEATLDSAHYPVPTKGGIVEWEMNMRGPTPLPNGRYRVEEVVWHYGLNPRIVVYMTPTA